MKKFFKSKKVLVTGAAGTVGSELVRQLAEMGTEEIRAVDNNESEIFFLMEEFKAKGVNCFIGDVRDEKKITALAEGIDAIIHCAAFKHVILSEYNPFDVVQTNIMGVENVIRAASATGVKRVLFTSSDKAVNPTNVMGASKLMGEKLITAANAVRNKPVTIFSSVRFGNVIGSRGSVVPIFRRQIEKGGPVTVTDERMTRFIMTIPESASLVLKSATISRGGEVFVTKMPVVRILDLASAMIEILAPRFGHSPSGIKIKTIGAKAGEKLYEELMSDEETRRTIELSDMFAVVPAFISIYDSIKYEYPDTAAKSISKSYVSQNEKPMAVSEIKDYLLRHDVLGPEARRT